MTLHRKALLRMTWRRLTRLRKELSAKIESIHKQQESLTNEIYEEVKIEVSRAWKEVIARLNVMVDQFPMQFHPTVLNYYKQELNNYVEVGILSNLQAKLSSDDFASRIEKCQKEMTSKMAALLKKRLDSDPTWIVTSGRDPVQLEMILGCDNLCADFKEDISFKFSFGIPIRGTLRRIQGQNQSLLECSDSFTPRILQGSRGLAFLPNHQLTPWTQFILRNNVFFPRLLATSNEWATIARIARALGAVGQGSFGGFVLSAMLLKRLGWKMILATGVIYAGRYLDERLSWTHKAMEREFKRQYVEHMSQKLDTIADIIISANCIRQVQEKLSSSFEGLSRLVDSTTEEMQSEVEELVRQISKLDKILSRPELED